MVGWYPKIFVHENYKFEIFVDTKISRFTVHTCHTCTCMYTDYTNNDCILCSFFRVSPLVLEILGQFAILCIYHILVTGIWICIYECVPVFLCTCVCMYMYMLVSRRVFKLTMSVLIFAGSLTSVWLLCMILHSLSVRYVPCTVSECS